MEAKPSLEMYRAEKLNIRMENFYDNAQGSALLFEARAGCLQTKGFVGKYSQNDGVFVVCGKETNYAAHSVRMRGYHTNLHEGNIRLPEAVGFKGSREGVNFKAAETTKEKIRMLVDEKQMPRTATTCNRKNKYFVRNKFFCACPKSGVLNEECKT